MSGLPYRTTTFGSTNAICPWCRADMGEATIRLTDLVEAWESDAPDWPPHEANGAAGSPLVADCPTCGRPSMVALAGVLAGFREGDRFLKLVPVRTATDARYLGRAA